MSKKIEKRAQELGFSHIAILNIEDHAFERAQTKMSQGLQDWLKLSYYGEMDYMQRHADKRSSPSKLVPGTNYVLSARMNYLPLEDVQAELEAQWRTLDNPGLAYVSVYARGRDYHKVLRARLQKLAESVENILEEHGYDKPTYRCFTDSAPVMEVALASQSGLGWRGKHTLLLSREAGSFFFLGEIFLTLPQLPEGLGLASKEPVSAHCGQCSACIQACPTGAILAPYKLDARRCISYLTIEHKGSIPMEMRPLMGNRIYGCDDCQLVCPWNKFAQASALADFHWRDTWVGQTLVDYFRWDEGLFLKMTEGSPIRRIGFERWQRNIVVAMGNALRSAKERGQMGQKDYQDMVDALKEQEHLVSPLVQEHLRWALSQAV